MTIEEIYQNIAQNMFNNLPEKWKESYLEVERDDSDAIGFKGGYINEVSEFTSFKFREFTNRQDLSRDFHLLYEIATEGGNSKWNKAKFTLYPSGKFSLDFTWDQEMADELSNC